MANEFNEEFLSSENDLPIADYVVMAMKEFEAVENIDILDYEVIMDPDEIDINEHTVNINYKKKSGTIDIPKYKYLYTNHCGEIKFRIRIHTNLHEKIITKKILIPIEYDGFYTLNNKKWKTLWQLVDGSTYSQRGKITLKSRMPIIIYQHKKRPLIDVHGEIVEHCNYSYALNSRVRRGASRVKTKFINPLMIFIVKIGLRKSIDFFGLHGVIEIVPYLDALKYDAEDTYPDSDIWRYFHIDNVLFRVNRELEENVKFVGSFTAMMYNLANGDFPVDYENLDSRTYWTCRIGYIGSIKSKNLMTFLEKGKTTVYMVERLLDSVTQMNLRLPDIYKSNIYYILRWMILDFDSLKNRNNLDINNKRIRKNEYIVMSSLGKKISENINKIIEKKSKSKLNTMDTILEMFNFGSDIIINGMRNINDLVKSDELVNDMTFLQDLAFSCKGPNSLGEQSSKMISTKYRNIHPSYMGKVDINVSSNSDVGMSGSFTPFLQLFNRFYFSPDPEPCDAGFKLEKAKEQYYTTHENVACKSLPVEFQFDTLEDYIHFVEKYDENFDGLKYEKIEIVEKTPEELTAMSMGEPVVTIGDPNQNSDDSESEDTEDTTDTDDDDNVKDDEHGDEEN